MRLFPHLMFFSVVNVFTDISDKRNNYRNRDTCINVEDAVLLDKHGGRRYHHAPDARKKLRIKLFAHRFALQYHEKHRKGYRNVHRGHYVSRRGIGIVDDLYHIDKDIVPAECVKIGAKRLVNAVGDKGADEHRYQHCADKHEIRPQKFTSVAFEQRIDNDCRNAEIPSAVRDDEPFAKRNFCIKRTFDKQHLIVKKADAQKLVPYRMYRPIQQYKAVFMHCYVVFNFFHNMPQASAIVELLRLYHGSFGFSRATYKA